MTKIKLIKIKGFRSFENAKINVAEKSLIIGANDVGKTNLIYALRILFDKKISENDLELFDSDYCIYSSNKEISIEVHLENVVEDCLVSIFKGLIHEDKTIIKFVKEKGKPYTIYCGFNDETMTAFDNRFYIRYLFMECVDTKRDLNKFMKKERNTLLDNAKRSRKQDEVCIDENLEDTLQTSLTEINKSIGNLKYIEKALDTVNAELKKLSIHHDKGTLHFTAPETDMSKVLSDVNLSFKEENQEIGVGGDGKNNQIFLATWISKQTLNENNDDYVCFYVIEEPEAHLHPHQQRKLSSYIMEKFTSQIFITSHSPFIGTNFIPKDIIKLIKKDGRASAASNGASEEISEGVDEFNYRLNIITSDLFFVDGIILVEGPSEKIFYQALCDQLEIDLDFYNFSIISTDGVGFAPYITMCQLLEIPYSLRTDNDIFKKTRGNQEYYFCSGLNRLHKLFRDGIIMDEKIDGEFSDSDFEWRINSPEEEKIIPEEKRKRIGVFKELLESKGLFLADKDLEEDLIKQLSIETKWDEEKQDTLITHLKKKKATNMYDFVKESIAFDSLKNKDISKPVCYLLKEVYDFDLGEIK
ncbi:TPA: AAA family ATPase [Enterococcus faecium]|uniref:ATP-dependent nuclease n=1 Tax=Enterococcus mundtii TaxID=53346 RepID=UPI0003C557B5|nr:AAA family ATPase [Enterococcus mundtii]BAO05899.1 putative ATP-dependent endonuclease of the OLD family protein [Enterococcus mundtii QU 25]